VIIGLTFQFRNLQKWQRSLRAVARRTGLIYQVGALSGAQLSGMYRGRYITIKGSKGGRSAYHSDPDLTRFSVALNRSISASASQNAMRFQGRHDIKVVGQALELEYKHLVTSEEYLLSLLDQMCDMADEVETIRAI